MQYLFPPVTVPVLPVRHRAEMFPVHRIYCVGRNYADHAWEMGGNPDREPPFFFCKPASDIVHNGQSIIYPPRTRNLHYEIELVVALGVAVHNIAPRQAVECIFGYAVGNDLTRRDLQDEAKALARPWETGKSFTHCAPVSEIVPMAECGELKEGRIALTVNGELRQESDLKRMVWSVNEVIAELSSLFVLKAGDLIFTGTPAGVGAVDRGDEMEGTIEKVGTLVNRIV